MKIIQLLSVTLLILLSSCSQSTYKETTSSIPVVKVSVEPYQRAKPSKDIEFQRVQNIAIKNAPKTKDVLVQELKDSNSIILANFNSGSAEPIFNYDFSTLTYLNDLINTNEAYTYRLVGHTNSMGGAKSNYTLSINRAKKVRSILRYDMNLNAGQIEYFGEGEDNPIDTNKTQKGRSNNSRIELRKIE